MGKPTAYTNPNCLSQMSKSPHLSIFVYAASMYYNALYILLLLMNLIWLRPLLILRVFGDFLSGFFLWVVFFFKSWSSKQSPPGRTLNRNICKSFPQTQGHAGTWTCSWTLVNIECSYSTTTYFIFPYGLSEFDFFDLAANKGATVGDCNTAAFCLPLCCFPLEEKTCLGKRIEAKWSRGYSSSLEFAFNHVVMPAMQHQLLLAASVGGCASASS